MVHELLVRVYNVGLGDCIYLQVPDGETVRHILIDCGNVYARDVMHEALHDLEQHLPQDDDGRRHLDLLVVTHRHKDHIAAFDTYLAWFKRLRIHHIWLSASMDPAHPQAQGARSLQGFARTALHHLVEAPASPALRSLANVLLNVSYYDNDDAVEALRTTLPALNGLDGDKPLYVDDTTPAAALQIFDDPAIQFHALAPVRDIDGIYLGKVNEALHSFTALGETIFHGCKARTAAGPQGDVTVPENISLRDFQRLKARLPSNQLAFVLREGELVNNTSLVLLLTWHGRRLLFTGDAQCKMERGGKFEPGKRNGCWNTMWARHKALLDEPLDFLKVGHHGSHNATPWVRQGGAQRVNQILDALLPAGAQPVGHVVVSTERTNSYETIPDRDLMETLGTRVANNVTVYSETDHYTPERLKKHHHHHLIPDGIPQPQRTDLHYQVTGKAKELYVDVRFTP
jgi:hypothetical protein